ncbi:hypothetical protein AVEN_42664-1 [Araneus ventricosus]|uniref:Uncharacterized protein n=1 Tax=Araneus ventricosus TaxID=182803 RepID=A0A4Y2BNF1_ARAVE|nr:hypothetical protein AVEN_42664-1 [Araneus ventricosus]
MGEGMKGLVGGCIGDWQEQNQHPNEGNRSDRKLESSLFQPPPFQPVIASPIPVGASDSGAYRTFFRSTLRHKSPFRPSLPSPRRREGEKK